MGMRILTEQPLPLQKQHRTMARIYVCTLIIKMKLWSRSTPLRGYVTGISHIKYADNKNMTDAASVILKRQKAVASKVITGLKSSRTY